MSQIVLSILQKDSYAACMARATLGQLIRQAREAQGLTGTQLAERLGIDPATLSRLERNKQTHVPAPDVVSKLHQVLGLSEEDMLRALGYLGDAKRPVQKDGDDLRAQAHAIIERMDSAHVRFALPVLTALERGITGADLAVLGRRQPPNSQ